MAGEILPPNGRFKRFFRGGTPYQLGVAVIALIAAAVSAADKQVTPAVILVVLAILTFIFTVAQQLQTWRKKEDLGSPHRLESSLYALYALLTNDVAPDNDPKLRLTIHVPVDKGTKLEQVMNYVGDERGGATAGRRFSVNVGIIGEAFRTREATVATRKSSDTEQYVRELISDWGYTEDEARKRDTSSMAWLAIPLIPGEGKQISAVVYLDATDPDFFTAVRFSIAICACVGLARYVEQVYSTKAR